MEGELRVSTRAERWAAIDRAVGRTIGDPDWVVALRRERAGLARPSEVVAQIRAGVAASQKILNPTIGITERRETGKLT